MTEKEYTQDQVVSVQRVIKKCKDYYEILEVSKDVTEAELKKKYRKLALELHPDKNRAPGAVEAFKAVGNAFAVLSDKEKRRKYDLYGGEEQQQTSNRRSYYSDGFSSYDYSRGFDADVSAEEIFNMFFGGGFPSSTIYVRRNNNRYRNSRHQENTSQEEPNFYALFVQLMPVLLLFLLSLMSSYLTPDPAFSLVRTSKYFDHKKTNDEFKIDYFVKENFDKDYANSIREVENQVLEEYISLIRSNCYKERNHRESMLWKARAYRDVNLEERAKNFKLPNCERLYQFQKYSGF